MKTHQRTLGIKKKTFVCSNFTLCYSDFLNYYYFAFDNVNIIYKKNEKFNQILKLCEYLLVISDEC